MLPKSQILTDTTTTPHLFNGLFSRKKLGRPAPARQTILDFTGARDDEVAVASAGPYANNLHLAPDR